MSYQQSKIEEINMLELNILIHSCIYYRFDNNVITDIEFDSICQRLVALKTDSEFKNSKYYKDFVDFDGSTGYNLLYSFKEILTKAKYLIDIYGGKDGGK